MKVETRTGNHCKDDYDLTIADPAGGANADLALAVCRLQAKTGQVAGEFCGAKKVFITANLYQPRTDFHSLANADQLCQDEADTASLPGSYRA